MEYKNTRILHSNNSILSFACNKSALQHAEVCVYQMCAVWHHHPLRQPPRLDLDPVVPNPGPSQPASGPPPASDEVGSDMASVQACRTRPIRAINVGGSKMLNYAHPALRLACPDTAAGARHKPAIHSVFFMEPERSLLTWPSAFLYTWFS